MKFTDGYWCIKKEMAPLYATEYADSRQDDNKLLIYAPGKHIERRGDCLNVGMLTIELSSPMEDVIKVSITHFEGRAYEGPFIKIRNTNPQVIIKEEEEFLIFQTGNTSAVVDKKPNSWGIRFLDGNKELTNTGFRNMANIVNKKSGKCYTTEALAIDVDEYIYGLGERFTPFIKNGQVVDMWNEDGGTSSEISYKNIPFYITNKGYGVLADNEGDVSYEIASEKVERIQFSVEGERLEYYVINGQTPKGTIQKYTELTGRPALPPAWSFGLWLTTSFTTNYDEETSGSFIKGMLDRDIPLHVFHFDCYWMEAYEWCNFKWDAKTFPDPEGMLRRYHEKGLKICVWINPYIGQKSSLFGEGMKQGYLLKKANGDVWQTDMWQPGMGLVDFTNPKAVKWYQNKLKKILDMGVDCFKTDFGERVPVRDIAYFDGSDPVKMHNYYTFLYNKAVFELLREERGEGDAVLFARSATVGGQQFPVHWGGDCFASYPSMAETLRSGLSLSCTGFGFWSHDIGGFESTASADIYKRWCQFGLLSSHSRLHGSSSYRVPWLFDEESCDVLRKFIKLKCRLMPYLYRQAVLAHKEGIPMMRPMFVEFPKDRACETLDKQYMLGDSLLVAPVFKESGEVEYYLPEGKWYNILTEETIEGGRWKKEIHNYFSMPLLAPANTILPIGKESSLVDYDYRKNLTLHLIQFEKGKKSYIEVPDLHGNSVLKIWAWRENNEITVKIRGDVDQLSCEVLGDEDLKINIREDEE